MLRWLPCASSRLLNASCSLVLPPCHTVAVSVIVSHDHNGSIRSVLSPQPGSRACRSDKCSWHRARASNLAHVSADFESAAGVCHKLHTLASSHPMLPTQRSDTSMAGEAAITQVLLQVASVGLPQIACNSKCCSLTAAKKGPSRRSAGSTDEVICSQSPSLVTCYEQGSTSVRSADTASWVGAASRYCQPLGICCVLSVWELQRGGMQLRCRL